MRTFDELEALWQAAPPAPTSAGTVRHLVLRKGGGVHELVDSAQLDVEVGLVGDRWAKGERPNPLAQVTLMEARVAQWLAHDTQPIDAPGDNILVDFDISEDALPAGTQVRVGEATLEVTPEPHMGCAKFRERFGPDALKWVNWKPTRSRRLRGVNTRVIRGGTVRVGDPVRVVS